MKTYYCHFIDFSRFISERNFLRLLIESLYFSHNWKNTDIFSYTVIFFPCIRIEKRESNNNENNFMHIDK